MWWRALCLSTQDILSKSGISAERIKGIGISSQSSTVLAVDRNGDPLHKAIIWMDSRGEDQRHYLRTVLDKLRDKVQVNPVESFFAIPKLLWLRENNSSVFESASVFLQANSYLVFRLTGESSIDFSEAGLQHIFDFRGQKYSNEICDILNLPIAKLPRIYGCSDIVGSVHADAAEATGLKKGTPVVAGTVDTTAAALGSGVVGDGQILYSVGTSGNLGACSKRLLFDKSFFIIPHPVPGLWLVDLLLGAAGSCLRWFRDQFGEPENRAAQSLKTDSYEIMNWEASRATPNGKGPIFLPYLVGRRSPDWNDAARGVFFGISLSTSREQIIRSIMEGCAFELLHNLSVLENHGHKVSEVRIVGQVARSQTWNQIWADVLEKTIFIPDSPGAPLGAAILAGKGVGLFDNLAEIGAAFARTGRMYTPNKSHVDIYRHLFDLYKRVSNKLDDEFRSLGNITPTGEDTRS